MLEGAALVASSKPRPLQECYTTLLTKGIRPEITRLTLVRKIATIVLIVRNRGACCRHPTSETTNGLSVAERVRTISGIPSGGGLRFSS